VIQALEFTIGPGQKLVDTFDSFRKKRNISNYDMAGSVSDKEAEAMFQLAKQLRADVEKWIKTTHLQLLS
jgi:hypothetical protein